MHFFIARLYKLHIVSPAIQVRRLFRAQSAAGFTIFSLPPDINPPQCATSVDQSRSQRKPDNRALTFSAQRRQFCRPCPYIRAPIYIDTTCPWKGQSTRFVAFIVLPTCPYPWTRAPTADGIIGCSKWPRTERRGSLASKVSFG